LDNDCKTFQYAVDAGVAFIMTEHIAAPAVTNGSPLPASVEPLLVKGVIRDRLGFKGIITSDDLWYPQVVNRFGAEEVAVKALEAGHDVILKPADPIATIKAISEAVRSGRIPEEQIDHSVRKLLIQKAALGLHKDKFVDIDAVSLKVGTPQNIEMVKRVADRSMTVLRNDGVLPVKIGAETKITHITIQKFDAQTPVVSELSRVFASSFNNVRTYNFKPFTSREYYDLAKSAATTSDIVVVSFLVPFTRNVDATPIRDQDLEMLNSILSTAKAKVIVMSYGNPHIIKKMESAPAFVTGFAEGDWAGNQIVYFDSFVRLLKGEYKPAGRLPIDLNEKYKIGFGLSY
jgi:beta-N-acetylhexosaminidase